MAAPRYVRYKSLAQMDARSEAIAYPVQCGVQHGRGFVLSYPKVTWGAAQKGAPAHNVVCMCPGLDKSLPTARRIKGALNAVRLFPTETLSSDNPTLHTDLMIGYNMLLMIRERSCNFADGSKEIRMAASKLLSDVYSLASNISYPPLAKKEEVNA